MSVSYADAASTKVPTKAEEPVSEIVQSPSGSPTNSTIPTSSEAESALNEEQKSTQKASKTLAPAPVPAKSVWGSMPAQSTTPLVDEHKFPSPGLIPQAGANTSKNSVKFGKSNKWIPITAKVVFSSPRNASSGSANGSSQKGKRKSKTPRKKSTSSNSNGEVLGKKEEGHNGQKSEADLESTASDATSDIDAHSLGQDQELQSSTAAGDAKQRQNSNTNYNQQKGYKKYPNGTYGARAPSQQQQQMPIHRQQGNGYYQPMVGQQFNGNGKQFRTIPGYGRNGSNGNLAMGAFIPSNGVRQMPGSMPFIPHHPQPMMSGMPFNPSMPIQIPPPLSPKQNPQQALTRQIDYYFSLDNLLRDLFLRKNMGTEGWVDLDLILNFKRVEIIINGLRNSIEEKDDKLKEEQLDKAIVDAVHQCENLEIGYLNGKESYNVSATEMQLRVKYNFEQWLLPDNL